MVIVECIMLESDWCSKEEVFKGMIDNLLLVGCCCYLCKLEVDLWVCEVVFFIGLGFSFVIFYSKLEYIE